MSRSLLIVGLTLCAHSLTAQLPLPVDSLAEASRAIRQLRGYAEHYRGALGGVGLDSLSPLPDSLLAPARNQVSVTNFYQRGDTLAAPYGMAHQTLITLGRQQQIAGVDFGLGGTVVLNDGRLDRARSGPVLTFAPQQFLRRLERTYAAELPDLETAYLSRVGEVDPRVALARRDEVVEEYLSLVNTPEYRELHRRAHHVADSLRGYDPIDFDDQSRQLIELAGRMDRLESTADGYLTQLRTAPLARLQNARTTVDSLRGQVVKYRDDFVRDALRRSGTLSGLQRLFLATRRFSLGNTRLPSTGGTSVGLPIRGVDYAVDLGPLSVEVQYGKRMASRRLVPRDGIAFHDLYRDFRLGRLALGYGDRERSYYELSVLTGRELGQARQTGVASAVPRRNRVLTYRGETRLGKSLSVQSYVSHAEMRPSAAATLPDAASPAGSSTAQLDLRLAAALHWTALSVEVAAFRTGSRYATLANPYLYTDYQGGELALRSQQLFNRLSAQFSLSLGTGTEAATTGNRRLRAQGQLQCRTGQQGMLSLVVSPNVYRYAVTGREGLAESSIYQLAFQQNATLAGRPAMLTLQATNLRQGWTWADTTSADADQLIVSGSGQLDLGEYFTLALDGLRTFVLAGEAGAEWFCAGGGSLRTDSGLALSARARYDRHAHEAAPAWGGSLDVSLPIGRTMNIHLNVFYRPARGAEVVVPLLPTAAATPAQLFSQQQMDFQF